MKFNKSTGGWLPLRQKDKPLVPGKESGSLFSKEGVIVFVVIMAVLIVGGIIYSHFFGPHM